MMMINRRRVCGGGKLPSGYFRVPFIQHTASSNFYLDTGIKATQDISLKLVFQMFNNGHNYQSIISAHTRQLVDEMFLYKDTAQGKTIARFGSTYVLLENVSEYNTHTFEINEKRVYWDGVQMLDATSQNVFQSDSTIILFGGWANNSSSSIDNDFYSRGRIIELEINDHIFVPAYGLTEQSYGLYDLKAHRFIYNSNLKASLFDTEVTFIKSDGYQYIDTGIVITNQSRLKMGVYITGTGGNFGCLDGSSARCHTDVNGVLFRVGNTDQAYTLGYNNMKEIDIDIPNLEYTIEGNTYQMTAPTALPLSTFCLFARNFSGTITKNSMALYSFQYYENGVLMLDYVPVRSNEMGFIFERVSGQMICSQGTRNFIIGSDVTT